MAKKTTIKSIDYNVTVLIPTYQTGPIFVRTIQSVLAQKNLKELIIIDNGNSNYVRGKIEDFAKNNDKINVILGQGNIGFARACNIGAKEATGDYLLILNPSCILPTNAFSKAIQPLENDPQTWISGCKILDSNNKEQPGNRRNLLSYNNLIFEWLGLYKFISTPSLELINEPINKPLSIVPAISSSFMMMKLSKFKELGEMDKYYFYNIADLDICFQVSQMGGKICFVNDLEVKKYVKSNEISKIILDKYTAKGLRYYFKKNFSGAYFPGSISLISATIFFRFLFQSIFNIQKSFINKLLNKTSNKNDISKYTNFVQKYKDFQISSDKNISDSKYYFEKNEPILVTDTESQSGLAILQRLLAANVKIIALYKHKPLDIYHRNLTWIHSCLDSSPLDLPKNIKIKTIISTSNIDYIPQYIEQLAAIGARRLIAICDIPNKNSNDKHSVAKQDIERICASKNINYTILQTSYIYGLDNNCALTSIYKFIRYFKSFPIKNKNANIYSPIHIDDISISTLKILNIKETYSATYNLIGADGIISYQDLVNKIFKSYNISYRSSDAKYLFILYKLFTKITNFIDSNKEIEKYIHDQDDINNNNAKNDFDFDPISFLNATTSDIGINI